MNLPFDRLAYIDRLREAGAEEPVAGARVQALREALEAGVATKADIEASEARMRSQIGDVRSELKGVIVELKGASPTCGRKSCGWTLKSTFPRDLIIKGAGGLVILASLMIGLNLFG